MKPSAAPQDYHTAPAQGSGVPHGNGQPGSLDGGRHTPLAHIKSLLVQQAGQVDAALLWQRSTAVRGKVGS